MEWARAHHGPDAVAMLRAATRKKTLKPVYSIRDPGFPGTDGTQSANRLAVRKHHFVAFRYCPR